MEQVNRSWSDLGAPWRRGAPGGGPEAAPAEAPATPGVERRLPAEGELDPPGDRTAPAATAVPTAEPAGPAFAPSTGSALVVVDDERERGALLGHLRKAGIQAFGASSGTEALSAVEIHRHPVVVADVDLPGLNGLELVRRLRERQPEVALLLLGRQERLAVAATAVGSADGCMPLPPEPGALVAWVRRALEHQALQEAHQQLIERIDRAASSQGLFDSLTGLPSRAVLDSRLQEALAGAQESGRRVAVLFVDLDGFKAVNDVLGHHAGDALLKELAGRLVAGRREGDTVARFGGDEFVVVCPEVHDAGDAAEIAGDLLVDLGRPLTADGYEHRVTASVGVAVSGSGAETAEDLLRNADLAMYRAKDDGRSRWALYEPELLEAAQSRYATRQRLRHAAANGELHLLYQPLVDLTTGGVVGAEALVRWQRPDDGVAEPADFLDIAEEAGLIRRFGDWVLDQALGDLATWRAGGQLPEQFRLWVNLWQKQAADGALPGLLAELCDRHAVPPQALGLDVSERVLADTGGRRVLGDVAATGVALGVDDFGSGRGDLVSLGELPLAVLKLDRRLVSAVSASGDSRRLDLVRSVVGLGLALGIPVVAKGVETVEQAVAVRAVGCSLGQGFLFGGPGDGTALVARAAAAAGG